MHFARRFFKSRNWGSIYRLLNGSRAIGTVPNKPWISNFLIGDNRIMTFLMIQVLASMTLHQLVAVFLVEGLANAASAVVQALEVNVHVLRVLHCYWGCWWRSHGRWFYFQTRSFTCTYASSARSRHQLTQISFEPIQILLAISSSSSNLWSRDVDW